MKHLTYGEKSLLLGDRAADLIVEYATALARLGGADNVTLNALDPDGNDVAVTFLLASGAALVVETGSTSLPEPPNHEAEEYMSRRLGLLEHPPNVGPTDDEDHAGFDHLE
jgi:hypothetical protein